MTVSVTAPTLFQLKFHPTGNVTVRFVVIISSISIDLSQSDSTETEMVDFNKAASDGLKDIVTDAINYERNIKKDPITKQFFPLL